MSVPVLHDDARVGFVHGPGRREAASEFSTPVAPPPIRSDIRTPMPRPLQKIAIALDGAVYFAIVAHLPSTRVECAFAVRAKTDAVFSAVVPHKFENCGAVSKLPRSTGTSSSSSLSCSLNQIVPPAMRICVPLVIVSCASRAPIFFRLAPHGEPLTTMARDCNLLDERAA